MRRENINKRKLNYLEQDRSALSASMSKSYFTLQLLSYAAVPWALFDQSGRSEKYISGMRQQELEMFVEQSYTAGVLGGGKKVLRLLHTQRKNTCNWHFWYT